jgi:hypothetical protein
MHLKDLLPRLRLWQPLSLLALLLTMSLTDLRREHQQYRRHRLQIDFSFVATMTAKVVFFCLNLTLLSTFVPRARRRLTKSRYRMSSAAPVKSKDASKDGKDKKDGKKEVKAPEVKKPLTPAEEFDRLTSGSFVLMHRRHTHSHARKYRCCGVSELDRALSSG